MKPTTASGAGDARPDLSVVVVSFNTSDLLRKCLQGVDAQAGDLSLEILVVDNASRDASADMVAAEFPHVRLIRSAANLGFAAANNLAFAKARGRYVLLLNPDAVARPGTLARAVARMDASPKVGAAGARLELGRIDIAGGERSFRHTDSVQAADGVGRTQKIRYIG